MEGNVVPVHQNNKQLVNNHRSVSLLLIYSKVFEKIVFDPIFEFMIENNLLSCTWSVFKPRDSCVNQFISIAHSVFSASDENPPLEGCGAFLDLSMTLDRV